MVFEAWQRQREVPRALLDDARPGAHLWCECDCATTRCTIRSFQRNVGAVAAVPAIIISFHHS